MAKQRVMVVGGGLAGLAAAMKLAELGIDVDLMSLTPVKRSHSVCAQGGINSVNDLTRQQGDSEWLHFDDTVYGGDFLQHQPPVKEMTDWGPKIIDLMDRLGVPSIARPKAFAISAASAARSSSGPPSPARPPASNCSTPSTSRSAAGKSTARSRSTSSGTFSGPVLDDNGVCRGCVGAGSGHDGDSRLPGRCGDRRLRRLRADLRPLDDVDGLHRQRRQPLLSGRREVRQRASSFRSIRRPFPAPTSCA